MKIQCDVCEKAEAVVLCCADEAALCWRCDEKVHAANKLAEKHQRVPLLISPSQIPTCDICQEKPGYFFCLEDRALLCRQCDVSIHNATTYLTSHQRFIVTGAKIGSKQQLSLPEIASINSSSNGKGSSSNNNNHKNNHPFSSPASNASSSSHNHQNLGLASNASAVLPEEVADLRPQWEWDHFTGWPDFEYSYGGNGFRIV
ncbi:putative salt tolerance-like protein [Acorus gramineus]|uniref:Salt tolerance-like protein n=1 Tax=Acorus gramineus TaxID=55184 RepID=A0AAV9AG53_ACOGR|nr:putative salt tolerance-like protein [Acorus gramineus]